MSKKIFNSVKLGVFVLAGLVFLVLLLYMIGRNRNIFGNTYILKTRFENVQGLVAGNNIRFSGIQAGTVKEIKIISDTVIEVSMSLDRKMAHVIRKTALAYVGTEGVVGNKIVNIIPGGGGGPFAEEGDMLSSKRTFDTDDMLQTLAHTNDDISIIAAELKTTIHNINNSSMLWALLNDSTIPLDLRSSIAHMRMMFAKAGTTIDSLHHPCHVCKEGQRVFWAIANGHIAFVQSQTRQRKCQGSQRKN